jgi:UDP-N-acetylmuramate dehydrogenase
MTVALSELTTMGVGGVPSELAVAKTRDELLSHAQRIWADADDWLVLGGGSNIVVSDNLLDLRVIKVENKGIERLGQGHIRVQAGENWDAVVNYCIEHGLG